MTCTGPPANAVPYPEMPHYRHMFVDLDHLMRISGAGALQFSMAERAQSDPSLSPPPRRSPVKALPPFPAR